MNTYAVITNKLNNKSTRVLVRNDAINSRQCNDAINRVGTSDYRKCDLMSNIPVTVLGSKPIMRITKSGTHLSSENEIRIIQNSTERYTVAYKMEQNENGGLTRIQYAVARTAPRDNYSRKLGRTIATGRLNSGKEKNVHELILDGSFQFPATGKDWKELEDGIKVYAESL